MPYFSHISNTYIAKKSLEGAIRNTMIESFDRRIIPDDELDIFKTEVLDEIHQLNAAHSRCKPIKATWYDFPNTDMENEWSLDIPGIFNFNIYKSK